MVTLGSPREEAEQGSLPELPVTESTRRDAQRASSVPPALVTAPSDGGGAVTQSIRERAQVRAAQLSARLMANFAGPSLLHSQPSTFADAHKRHHEAAGLFMGSEAWLVKAIGIARLGWAYVIHLPAKALTRFTDWVLESPVTALCALVIYTACHFWLWRSLPWFWGA